MAFTAAGSLLRFPHPSNSSRTQVNQVKTPAAINCQKQEVVKSSLVSSSKKTLKIARDAGEGVFGLSFLGTDAVKISLEILKSNVPKTNKLASQVQIFIETGMLNCRFFTLLAVAGSLLGSFMCLLEGCSLTLDSFFAIFLQHQTVDGGQSMRYLVEAMEMYLLGTGMLNFGFSMYAMFVRVGKMQTEHNNNLQHPILSATARSNLHQKILTSGMERQWVSQAKSKLGRALLMMLQAGTVDKFKYVNVSTALDLVCFAGAIFIISTSLFLLSRMIDKPQGKEE
ncbi:hypothetical protein ZOSMA_49G00610 [Zostera marina]|uniref:Transmembrane protein n=1 Tax=Zostera marina TaxID=29655 RepID=A0A0K9NZ42_ZOSMR|nr:hypothetical protein ZOSMA_49G00610 [Zostera marina]